MYIKGTKSAGHSYIQLAESYRDDNGKPRQRVLSTIGRADESGGQVDCKRAINLAITHFYSPN